MGAAQEIIKRHVGNPEGLLGVLDNLVYYRAANQLGYKMLNAYRAEIIAANTIEDPKTKLFAIAEAERLKALADELLTVGPSFDSELAEIIAARYMVNPNRSK